MRGRSNGEIDKDSRSLPPCSPSPLIPPQYSHPPPFSTIVSATIIRHHRPATTYVRWSSSRSRNWPSRERLSTSPAPILFPRDDGQPERRGWASFGGKVVVPHSPTTANPERHDHRGSQSSTPASTHVRGAAANHLLGSDIHLPATLSTRLPARPAAPGSAPAYLRGRRHRAQRSPTCAAGGTGRSVRLHASLDSPRRACHAHPRLTITPRRARGVGR
jgi:hypothetical protein